MLNSNKSSGMEDEVDEVTDRWKEGKKGSIWNSEDEVNDNRVILEVGAIRKEKHKMERSKIEYDKCGGRPSMRMRINGIWRNCLLDTGATMNVIDEEVTKELGDIKVRSMLENVSCANGSALQVKGKSTLEIKINGKKARLEFTIAKNVSPKVIAGSTLLREFGIQLRIRNNMQQTEEYICKDREELCAIEAKFGKQVNDEMRLKVTLDILNITKESELYDILVENKGVFMANKWDIGKTSLLKHTILTNEEPVLIKPYRQPVNLESKIDEAIKNLEENGIIRRCNSAWNAPLVCIWKKEKKDIRLCLDFRALNKVTERNAFPMPNIEDMLDTLNGSKYFSSIDLGSAYYQVELEEDSKKKTAFSTKSGQYCFNRMPFGIAAAPATFQKLMTIVLGELNWKEAVVYMDDILIFAKTRREHKERLGKVLKRIREAGLRVNPEKCEFLRKEIKFLGHIINGEGIQTDSKKIEAITEYEKPKCIKKLRSFLGVCNYYRKFIKDYSKLARNLESLCGSNKDKLVWSVNVILHLKV